MIMKRVIGFLVLAVISSSAQAEFAHDKDASPRVLFGIEKLKSAIASAAFRVDPAVIVAKIGSPLHGPANQPIPFPEGFALQSRDDGTVHVIGADDSGCLYGCLELASRIRASKQIPK